MHLEIIEEPLNARFMRSSPCSRRSRAKNTYRQAPNVHARMMSPSPLRVTCAKPRKVPVASSREARRACSEFHSVSRQRTPACHQDLWEHQAAVQEAAHISVRVRRRSGISLPLPTNRAAVFLVSEKKPGASKRSPTLDSARRHRSLSSCARLSPQLRCTTSLFCFDTHAYAIIFAGD